MKEAITKCYQKSQSRARARAFLGQRGSQSRATFFHKLKREPRAEPLKKWPGSPSLAQGGANKSGGARTPLELPGGAA